MIQAPSSSSPPDLRARIEAEAHRLGFDAIGFARADLALDDDFARYEAFVDRGMHGEMSWLADARDARRRVDGDAILPGAKTVICLARRYGRSAESEASDPETARTIARYARGRDYHNGVRKKLRKLAALTRTLAPDVKARPLCDEEPILERAWAARAGLGFVGKNGLLIVPGTGSFVLLGEVVTTLAIDPDEPMTERCGSCTRCLDACPTQAFEKPFVLDPRRCVAYLTIEHRSSIDDELRAGIGPNLFGCDECQTVCPFNAGARARGGDVDQRFLPDVRWNDVTLEDVLMLDDEGFVRLREGSPIGRATRRGLARNAAIALGNRGAATSVVALERARDGHDDAIVRDAAAWAIDRISNRRP